MLPLPLRPPTVGLCFRGSARKRRDQVPLVCLPGCGRKGGGFGGAFPASSHGFFLTGNLEMILLIPSTSIMPSTSKRCMQSPLCPADGVLQRHNYTFGRTTSPPRAPTRTGAGAPPQSMPVAASTSRTVATPAAALPPRAELRPRDRNRAESARGSTSTPPPRATKTTKPTPTSKT